MSTVDLLSSDELPDGFRYPAAFERIVGLGLIELEPWSVLDAQSQRARMAGLAKRYPDRRLIPFAARQDNDDVACWQVGDPKSVLLIHDFASPGWEHRATYPSFYDWFRQAIQDLIDFDCSEW